MVSVCLATLDTQQCFNIEPPQAIAPTLWEDKTGADTPFVSRPRSEILWGHPGSSVCRGAASHMTEQVKAIL